MIHIGNIDIVTPSSYVVDIMDITNSERDSKGNMHIDLINTKYKLELSWNFLNKDDMKGLLKALHSNITFEVEFIDPATGDYKKATFYKGDRKIGMLDFIKGEPRWKDIKVNLIEV